MPPPVVGLVQPAASPLVKTRWPYGRLARARGKSRALDLYARGVQAEALRPERRPDLDAGALSGGAELAVELAAVDDRDSLAVGGEGEDPVARRVDQAGRRTTQH